MKARQEVRIEDGRRRGGTGSEDVMEGVGVEAEQEVRIGMEDDGHGGGTEMRIGIG